MITATKALLALSAAALLASPILAQQGGGGRLPAECREEIVALCGTDRAQMRTCLREKAGALSDTCRTALRERMEARRDGKRGGQRGGETPSEAPTNAPANSD